MNIDAIANELSSAKLVGIGESTHGTHEFFDLKSKLFKELLVNHSFSTLLLEDSDLSCRPINEYISTGNGNLNDLMEGLYSVWRVEELRNLIIWLKENYKKHKVALVGFDINQSKENLSQRDKLMAKNIQRFVNDNPETKAMIWAHNSHIQIKGSNFNQQPMGLYLKSFFDKDYIAIAQLFGKGSVSATRLKMNAPPSFDRKLGVIDVDSIPPELTGATLDKINSQPYFLNKAQIEKINNQKIKLVRSIGWGLIPEMANEITEEIDMPESFDGLIYFPKTKHTKPLT